VAIKHCNKCYLTLLWFSRIASILVDYALTVKVVHHARTLQILFIFLSRYRMPGVLNSFGAVGHNDVLRFCAGQTILHNDTIGSFIYYLFIDMF